MSKRFRFALQPILEERTRVERTKRTQLLFAQAALHEATRDTVRLGDAFRIQATALGNYPSARSVDFCAYFAHLEYLDCAIRQRVKTVRSCEMNVEFERLAFVEATKMRKALEKLRFRRAHAHGAVQRILEEREMDESNRLISHRRRGH